MGGPLPRPARPAAPASSARPAAPCLAVCVATYGRPLGLRRLLNSLAELEIPAAGAPVVVVVDNDAAESARPVVAAAGAAFPLELAYAVEPERNIALARNRGVAVALERGAQWLAFVDDDETVHPGWLRELLDARDRLNADVVAGTVRARWPQDTPGWLAQERFYAPPRAARPRAVLTGAYTGNVLVRAALLAGPEGPFDPRYGLSGGSDSYLFMRLHRAGARIVYADQAVTEEVVPPARARAGWVLRRAFRIGNTAVFCERDLARGAPAARLAKSVLRLGMGVASLPLALVGGRGLALRALWNVSYGCGALAGAAGIRYREYARPQLD